MSVPNTAATAGLAFLGAIAWALVSAAALHLVRAVSPPRPGRLGPLSRAPGVDAVIAWLIAGPPLVAGVAASITGHRAAVAWGCAAAAVAGQIVALYLWSWAHERLNPDPSGRPRLVHVVNRNLSAAPRVPPPASSVNGAAPARADAPTPVAEHRITLTGRLRNHAALLWTLWAVPVLLAIRFAQYVVYPVLVRTARLPRYDHAEWVNLSRHKVDGLVGHDLVWCLYCDWMTGVWSLASEMLRNVESFWCPIRFASPEKCANCAHDFPDVVHAWVPADRHAAEAARLLADRYPAPDGSNAWLGHPVRLTVRGEPAATPTVSRPLGDPTR